MLKARSLWKQGPSAPGLYHPLLDAALEYLRVDGDHAWVYDPYFDLKRCRVTAEVCKAMLRTGRDPATVEKMIAWLASRQNPDGSWDEIHPRYARPSALATAFVGEALLLKKLASGLAGAQEESLSRAAEYVLAAEVGPGYFRKSQSYLADYLNVDASCGAFLAACGEEDGDTRCLAAARGAAENCLRRQLPDGAYPYTTAEGGKPEPYPFHVPCIHYQGVTIYYLTKVQRVIRDPALGRSLRDAGAWLAGVQRPGGGFDWSRSGLPFASCLSGAYAFAAASFDYCGLYGHRDLALQKLETTLAANSRKPGTMPAIAMRWERGALLTLPLDAVAAFKAAMIGDFPQRHRLFRLGYGLYRQCARRRFSERIDDGLFNFLSGALRLKTSTVDPFSNYPDLFMTSEILDCLSSLASSGRPGVIY